MHRHPPATVVFRADASRELGSGHLMRCLTLAEALRARGRGSLFLSRELPGHLCGLLETRGFAACRLPAPAAKAPCQPASPQGGGLGVPWQEDARQVGELLRTLPRPEWLVVDSYALDASWERALRPLVGRLMVIDDLADRAHDCDLLLDQNLCAGMETRYRGLLPAACRTLLGPRHALLRPEFAEASALLGPRDGRVGRLLVFLGGSDPTGQTGKVLRALGRLERPDLAVEVVAGAGNPRREELRSLCAGLPGASFHLQVDHMARLMLEADLAVGGGGSTTWERCLLGLPSLIMVLADNQLAGASAVAEEGGALLLGRGEEVSEQAIADALASLLADPGAVRAMGERALALMGGAAGPGMAELLDLMGEGGRDA